VAQSSYAAPGNLPPPRSHQSSPRTLRGYDASVLSPWGYPHLASLRYFPSLGDRLFRPTRGQVPRRSGVKLDQWKQCLDQPIAARTSEPCLSPMQAQPLAAIEVPAGVCRSDVPKLRPYPDSRSDAGEGGQAICSLHRAGEGRKHEPRMANNPTTGNRGVG
jgi:hypothetical protein